MDALVKADGNPPSSREQLLQRYYVQQDEETHLRDYWRIVLKHRWIVLTFFAIIVTTAIIYTFSLTPTYRATASLKIDYERPQILSFQEIGSPGHQNYGPEFMGTQQKLLQSRSLAKRVIETLKTNGQPIAIDPALPDSTVATAFWPVWLTDLFGSRSSKPSGATESSPRSESETVLTEEQVTSRKVDALLRMLTVEPIRTTNMVKISFTTPSSDLSSLLANTWVKAFIDHNLDMKYNATAQAGEWLSKQLQDVRDKLEQSEAALHEFVKEKQILTVGEKKDIVTTKLADLSEALTKAQGERIAREALYRQSQGMRFDSIPAVLENSMISNLRAEYYKLDSESRRLSETYKPGYPKMVRLREGMDQIKRQIETEIAKIIDAIKQEYEAAVKKEQLLQAAVNAQKHLAIALNQELIRFDILKRDVDTYRQIYSGILERQKQAGVSQGLAASNVQVVDLAEPPGAPFSPNKTRNILLGIVLGLTVAIGVAFFFDYLDNTVKHSEELERTLGIPSLALIPSLASAIPRQERNRLSQDGGNGDLNGRPVFALVAHSDLRSTLTEAFRTLRTSLLFSSPESPPKSILFTSAQPAEGKTGLSINTSISLSQLGGSVLLIDGDMRRPSCHAHLELPLKPGLSEYLTGNADLVSIIKRTTVPNLHCIPAGTIPVNPAELLASTRTKETIELLSQRFDYIIIDSPPVFAVADALILSTVVKGVILVVQGGRTPREMVQRAFKNLLDLNAPVLGAVLNNVNIRGNGYPYYYDHQYSHYYQQTPADAPHPRATETAQVVEDTPIPKT
ncbi:MAG: polysaccharide biosynthesis tyrosine autokinase [bacterium]|uniref:non-specific protein-tyrosine kinase n=1 Tax=Candidatus Methylomirabilis tolerans TaxID=3123416 RepID=A0AAJ1AJ31_9BACT|nr:polysaccharide biosynthesis tyrosine autokinase [Candidatus Methylomirabilis sp.]